MRTPITYYGGKQTLAQTIVSMLPAHKIYCEPFFGGGAVFFAKPKSYLEAINDTNERIVTFYKQVMTNFDELQQMVQTTLDAESEYKKAREIYNRRRPASDVETAWAVWMVTNFSFSGSPRGGWKWDNGNAGSHTGVYMRRRRHEFAGWLHDRLADVQISCRDALDVIRQRDTTETVFYLDPPYPMADMKHYSDYSFENLEELLTLLQSIHGKFILSNYSSELLDKFISKNGWRRKDIELPLKVANFTQSRHKVEVLVSNFAESREQTLFDYNP